MGFSWKIRDREKNVITGEGEVKGQGPRDRAKRGEGQKYFPSHFLGGKRRRAFGGKTRLKTTKKRRTEETVPGRFKKEDRPEEKSATVM